MEKKIDKNICVNRISGIVKSESGHSPRGFSKPNVLSQLAGSH